MVTAGSRKARLDARELAASRPADPYRGALTDPYTALPGPAPVAGSSVGDTAAAVKPADLSDEGSVSSATEDHQRAASSNNAPGPAVIAGIIALALGAVLGLFGLLLLAIISLQDQYGAPDRSFYKGSDSSYLLLALLNFGLGGCLVIGGISFLTGRLNGRLAITVAGWTVIAVCGFWWSQGTVTRLMPLVICLSTVGMLALSYHRSVTRWLGVLPAAQPE